MKSLIALSFVLAVMTGAAFANDTMDAMIGASVTYTYGDGNSVTAVYNADGTYTTDTAGGGAWTINGDELCITTDDGASGCTDLEAGHSAGDSWDGIDAFGNPVTISIE
jgi:hypothetical protein